jgi:hypothetical protein
MLNTYHGILRGDHIQWDQDAPCDLPKDTPVSVYVTILNRGEKAADVSEPRKILEALERLAGITALRSISDPAAWQREQRADRFFLLVGMFFTTIG